MLSLVLTLPAMALGSAAVPALNNWLIAAVVALLGLTVALFGHLIRMRAAIGAKPLT